MNIKLKGLLLVLSVIVAQGIYAQVWQWSVPVGSAINNETKALPQAFLWIPEDCEQVNGIVFAMHNMVEEGIMEHAAFRKTLSEIGFAEVWITPPMDMLWDTSTGVNEALFTALSDLADVSGYAELAKAPIVPIGHSACATFPWNFAAFNKERTLALISIKGDAPQTTLTGCSRPNLAWGAHNIDGIPSLMIMSEAEWWEDRLTPAIAYKDAHPRSLISLLADAGGLHFDYSDYLVNYMALFIKKAATLSRPYNGLSMERWYPDAYHADNAERPNTSFWYIDNEMANATKQYYNRERNKKERYVTFLQDGKPLKYDPSSRHLYANARFDADGITFHLSAAFADSLKQQILPYADANIRVSRICGPVEIVNDTTFRVAFYRMGMNNTKRTPEIWLLAECDGDDVYKRSAQQIGVRIPYRNTVGKMQSITFPPITDNKLIATSSSGLPVQYYIKEGAATIVDNRIVLAPLPPNAKPHHRITVVAYQYGIANEWQTAEPIEQILIIN